MKRIGSIIALVTAASATPATASLEFCADPKITVVSARLSDNGDDDGFADPRERVLMRLEVRNTTDVPMTGVQAHIESADLTACPVTTSIQVGALAPGEQRVTDQGFEIDILELQRSDPFEPLTASFQIGFTSDQLESMCTRKPVTLDLDLDVTGGGSPDVYFESFESGTLGTFAPENLDAGIPGNNDAEGLVNGDGWRCQYDDPDWVNSNSYGAWSADACYPGMNLGHSNAVFWQADGASISDSPDGGRAYTGNHSMYYGIFLTTPAGNFTTPMALVDSVSMTDPVHLGLGNPTLSFMHQVSLVDDRALGAVPPLRSADRGIVQIQVVDDEGDPASPFSKLEPYLNIYDSQNIDNYFNCMFDPIDDGNNEDDFYDPEDPNRRHGPSSTCFPEYAWTFIGDTEGTDTVGNANEGPALTGSLGDGLWIESAFDLSRWRGRSVRVRYLATTIKATQQNWEWQFQINPDPRDDGWWIDDVTISDTLDDPAVVTVDSKDNLSLPGPGPDGDVDGRPDVCDNCAATPNANQEDIDGDGIGAACDPCVDVDGDGFGDPEYLPQCGMDNCLLIPNPDQLDDDLDGLGDVCDFCNDIDGDGYGIPGFPAWDCESSSQFDNCPFDPNPDQTDVDQDGFGEACDCNDAESAIHAGAEEINDGLDNQCPGDEGYGLIDELAGMVFRHPGEINWTPQPNANRYEVVRADTSDFTADCVVFPWTTSPVQDLDEAVPPGTLRHYLVRTVSPNPGTWGVSSSGTERTVPCVP